MMRYLRATVTHVLPSNLRVLASQDNTNDIVFRDVLASLTVCMTASLAGVNAMAPYRTIFWKELHLPRRDVPVLCSYT